MKVLEDKENFLFNRKEVKILVESDSNPKYQEAEAIIVMEFKAALENIAIKRIKGEFGQHSFVISAFIYKSKEDKEKYEPKPKQKKTEGQPVQEVKK